MQSQSTTTQIVNPLSNDGSTITLRLGLQPRSVDNAPNPNSFLLEETNSTNSIDITKELCLQVQIASGQTGISQHLSDNLQPRPIDYAQVVPHCTLNYDKNVQDAYILTHGINGDPAHERLLNVLENVQRAPQNNTTSSLESFGSDLVAVLTGQDVDVFLNYFSGDGSLNPLSRVFRYFFEK
jgi:hypothetical protein